jgi:hypothetical protein
VILVVTGALFLGSCNSFKLSDSSDDKAITTDIQAKLFSDPVLKTRDIRVDAQRGIVTLSGTVGTDLEKAAVERIASQENGVKSVINMLAVSSQSGTSIPEASQTAEVAPPAAPPDQTASTEQAPPAHHHKSSHSKQTAAAQPEGYADAQIPEAPANPPAPPKTDVAPVAPAAPPVAAAPPPPPPPPPPKPPERVTIPSGTVATIRMIDNIDSSRNRPGEEFAASLDAPLVVGDRVIVARGADARVRLVNAESAGHITGRSELQLELVGLTIRGTSYPTESGYYEQHGGSRGQRSAETIGGGAIMGALIGGLLGRGKGAAIGSGVGAGAGTVAQVSTKGQQVKVPSETKLDFTLKQPLVVTMGPAQ